MLGGFVFGWAKPVPVNFRNLRDPKRDMAVVAAAGPFANLLMAGFWALMIKFGIALQDGLSWIGVPLALMGEAGIAINIVLMVLNLLPIPPLDGGRVVSGLLPQEWSLKFDRIEPFGLIILLALLATGVLAQLIGPIYLFLVKLIQTVFSLPV
jgi:Zn-dependent protease